jgi:hypothetical protein
VIEQSDPGLIPAGFGCSFDVQTQPLDGSRIAITEFDDGRVMAVENANAILTNLDTGATFLHRARFHVVETYDPASNDLHDETSGRVNINFYPGDLGPFGVVTEPGALLRFVGHVSFTIDLDTGLVTEFSNTGTVTDVCSLLE